MSFRFWVRNAAPEKPYAVWNVFRELKSEKMPACISPPLFSGRMPYRLAVAHMGSCFWVETSPDNEALYSKVLCENTAGIPMNKNRMNKMFFMCTY